MALAERDKSRKSVLTPDAVRQWADDGKLASFRTPGGQRRFRREDVEAFLTNGEDAA